MTYKPLISQKVRKQLKKMEKSVAYMLAKKMQKDLNNLSNPRSIGKALLADKKGLWSYRTNQYRVISGN